MGKCTAVNRYGDECLDPCNPAEQTCKNCRLDSWDNMSAAQTDAYWARNDPLKENSSPDMSAAEKEVVQYAQTYLADYEPPSPDMDEAAMDPEEPPSPPFSPPAADDDVYLNDAVSITLAKFKALDIRLTKPRDNAPKGHFKPIAPAPLSGIAPVIGKPIAIKPVVGTPPERTRCLLKKPKAWFCGLFGI